MLPPRVIFHILRKLINHYTQATFSLVDFMKNMIPRLPLNLYLGPYNQALVSRRAVLVLLVPSYTRLLA